MISTGRCGSWAANNALFVLALIVDDTSFMEKQLIDQSLDQFSVVFNIDATILIRRAINPGFHDACSHRAGFEAYAKYADARPTPIETTPSGVERDELPVFHVTRHETAL